MNRRIVALTVLALALGGCATYQPGYAGYADGSYSGVYNDGYYVAPAGGNGDYYYDRPQVLVNEYPGYYGGPYAGFGFGYSSWGFGYDPWFFQPLWGFGYGPWWGNGRHHSWPPGHGPWRHAVPAVAAHGDSDGEGRSRAAPAPSHPRHGWTR